MRSAPTLTNNSREAIQQALSMLADLIPSPTPPAPPDVFVWDAARTWASLYADVVASGGYGIVLVPNDGPKEMTPSGSPTDLSKIVFVGLADSLDALPTISIDSAGIGGFVLGGNNNIQSKDVQWETYYEIGQGTSATWKFDGGGLRSATNQSAWRGFGGPAAFTLHLYRGALFDGGATMNGLVRNIRGSVTVYLTDAGTLGKSSFANNAFAPPWPPATVIRDSSGIIDPTAWIGTFSPYTITDIDRASAEFFDDSLATPPLYASNVQAAIDAIKGLISSPPSLFTSILPTIGGKPGIQEISPAGHLWLVNFGSGGLPSKPYGLECYDIASNPAKPSRISYTGSPTFAWFNVEAIRFRAATMFAIANGPANALKSVDTTNPAAPTNIGSLALNGATWDLALSPNGNTAVIAQSAGSGLVIADVTNAAAMAILSSAAGQFLGVDTTLWPYVVTTNIATGRLEVYDLTNLAAPVLFGSLALSATIRRVVVDPTTNVAYVATTTSQLVYVVSVSNPSAPVLLASFGCSTAGDDTPLRLISAYGRRLLVCPGGAQDTSPSTITTYDVSNPAAPSFLRAVDVSQNIYDCTIIGPCAYASNRSGPQELMTLDSRFLVA